MLNDAHGLEEYAHALMGEGVSLSLPGKGVPRDNHLSCVVLVPSSREHIYYGGCILSISAVISVPGTREHGSDPFPKDHDLFGDSNMLGLGPGMGISHNLRVGRKLSTNLGMDESMVAKNPVRNTILVMVRSLRTSSLFRYKDLGTSRDLIIDSLVPNKVHIWAFLQVQILFERSSPVQIVACKREPVSFVGASIGHGIRSQLLERLSIPPRGMEKCSACVGAFTLRGSESRVSDLSDKIMRLDP